MKLDTLVFGVSIVALVYCCYLGLERVLYVLSVALS